MGSLPSEIKRRKVIRVAGFYVLAAWVLLQVADLAFESWGIPSEALRYVWIGAIAGFPIALFLGWRFDIIGGHIVRTPVSSDDTPTSLQRTDHLILTVVAFIAVAITAGLLFEISRTRPSMPDQVRAADIDPRSIAVLPFEDMSASQDQQYFGDGIAEELLNRLAKVKDFRVAGRTSSFSFKGQTDDLRSIGEKLNVAVVLEGSVRTTGDQVRITAQLINAADGFHLWSETYDREMDNVFAIQDEIAGSVVNAIMATLVGETESFDLAPATVANSEAYVLYLKGRHLLYQRSGDAAEQQLAMDLFEQAIDFDPDYAPAHAGLSTALVLGPLDFSEMSPRAEAAIDRALALEPGNSEAYATLGLLRQLQGRPEESRSALHQAIAHNINNAQAHAWLGRSYNVSDPARYLEHVRNAYRIDPLDPTTLFHLSTAATVSGQYEEALAAARERFSVGAGSGPAYWLAGNAHHNSGHLDRALKTSYRALIAPMTLKELIAMAEYDLARAWLSDMASAGLATVPHSAAAMAFLDGDPERAVRLWTESMSSDLEVAYGHLVFGGDAVSARDAYERGLTSPGDDRPHFDPESWLDFFHYAVVLQQTGSAERAHELAAELITLVEAQLAAGVVVTPSLQIELGAVLSALHGISGDRERAMKELRLTADRSSVLWFPWVLRYWPHWESLRSHPEFELLVAEQEAKLAAIRQDIADEGMLLTPAEVLQLENFSFDPFLFE